jgi:hypothetical protein
MAVYAWLRSVPAGSSGQSRQLARFRRLDAAKISQKSSFLTRPPAPETSAVDGSRPARRGRPPVAAPTRLGGRLEHGSRPNALASSAVRKLPASGVWEAWRAQLNPACHLNVI